MYTYDEIIEAYIALNEASATMVKFIGTTKDLTEIAVTAKVVSEYHSSKLSDDAKELYDKMMKDDRVLNNEIINDYTYRLLELKD